MYLFTVLLIAQSLTALSLVLDVLCFNIYCDALLRSICWFSVRACIFHALRVFVSGFWIVHSATTADWLLWTLLMVMAWYVEVVFFIFFSYYIKVFFVVDTVWCLCISMDFQVFVFDMLVIVAIVFVCSKMMLYPVVF